MSFADKFHDLFAGLDRAHATLSTDFTTKERETGPKVVGKLHILHTPPTVELWKLHLKGERSLGVFPLNDEGLCRWGAIDVDEYDQDLVTIAQSVAREKLPLTVVRSKSGGAHLYLFCKEWVPAGLMQQRLREIAAYMGFSSGEVFPKQTKLVKERDDTGNGLNMPYFNESHGTRYAFDDHGKAMTAEKFLAAAQSKMLTKKQLEDYTVPQGNYFIDGPPCLQTLDMRGVGEGGRNNFLMQAAVYFRRKYPEGWKEKLAIYNKERVDPPLPEKELLGICESLERKDYFYSCSKAPFNNVCNNALCKARKFGVGSKALPLITGLTKLDSRPAIWFMTVEGQPKPLQLDTDSLMNQGAIRKAFMEQHNILVPTVKRDVWDELLALLLQKLQVIEVTEDTSAQGYMKELLQKFCVGTNRAKSREDILTGRAWHDEGAKRHFFKLSSFTAFLDKHRFKDMARHEIANTLREMRGEAKGMRLGNSTINVWSIPEFFTKETEHERDMTKL